MEFNDLYTNAIQRFSLGLEKTKNIYYISIPVSNPYVDYEEYYEISIQEFNDFMKNSDLALDLVKKCRNREYDSFLIQKPGSKR